MYNTCELSSDTFQEMNNRHLCFDFWKTQVVRSQNKIHSKKGVY